MITIAHRLQTVMNSDRVFVIDQKQVIEQGAPQALMDDTNSKFQYFVKKMQDSGTNQESLKWVFIWKSQTNLIHEPLIQGYAHLYPYVWLNTLSLI